MSQESMIRRVVTVIAFACALGGAGLAIAQARVEIEVRHISGPLSQSAANIAMRDSGNAVQRCLRRLAPGVALSFAPRAFTLEVDASGAPTARDTPQGMSGTPTTVPAEAQFRTCIRAALSRARFPSSPDGPSAFAVTVRLQSE